MSKNKDYQSIVLLSALLLIIFATIILGENAAESLLIATYTSQIFPKMYIINALILFLVSLFLITFIDKIDRTKFYIWVIMITIFMLAIIRLLLFFHFKPATILFFGFFYLVKTILFMIFWTIANDIIDAQKAKKYFPVIAGVGIIGSAFSSLLTKMMVNALHTENLLFLCILLLVVSIFMFLYIQKKFSLELRISTTVEKKKEPILASLKNNFLTVKNEPLLRNMAWVYFLVFFLLFNYDYQFYHLTENFLDRSKYFEKKLLSFLGESNSTTDSYQADAWLYRIAEEKLNLFKGNLKDNIASFLGLFKGICTTITFFLQFSFIGYFFKRLGTARSFYMLPLTFLLIFSAFTILKFANSPLMLSGLIPILIGMSLRLIIFESFFSPNFQIFFGFIPQTIRGRGKMFIDGVVKPLAICTAGFSNLLFIKHEISLTHPVYLISLTLLAGLLVRITSQLKNTLNQSVTQSYSGLQSQAIHSIFDIQPHQFNPELLPFLEKAIQEQDSETKLFAITMLGQINTPETTRKLLQLMNQYEQNTETCIHILKILGERNDPAAIPTLMKYLLSGHQRLIANTITCLGKFHLPEKLIERLLTYIHHPNNRVKANTIITLWKHLSLSQQEEARQILKSMIENPQPYYRGSAIYAYGELGFLEELIEIGNNPDLLNDYKNNVRQNLIKAFGKIQHVRSFEWLVETLNNSNSLDRVLILRSLQLTLPAVVNTLPAYLKNQNNNALLLILHVLGESDFKIRKKLVADLQDLAHHELHDVYYHYFSILSLAKELGGHPSIQLLISAIQENAVDVSKKILIKVVEILDESQTFQQISRKLMHPNSHIKATAIAVLENVGERKITRLMIPLFEEKKLEDLAELGKNNWNFKKTNIYSITEFYLNNNDRWIKATAIFALYDLWLNIKDRQFMNLLNKNLKPAHYLMPEDIETKLHNLLK